MERIRSSTTEIETPYQRKKRKEKAVRHIVFTIVAIVLAFALGTSLSLSTALSAFIGFALITLYVLAEYTFKMLKRR